MGKNMKIKAPRGTQDILPGESSKWQYVENELAFVAASYGYNEIRTPVFEHTELFQRGVGDTTDVVSKEMYTFNDKGDRSITLRPEGTAGAARAVLEKNLLKDTLPLKVYYLTSCYRYEKPQAGRLREFHQFGAEMYGTDSPRADAELISLASEIFESFDLSDLRLEINSIGCPECRKKYLDALREYYGERQGELCEDCKNRLDKNPMRLLDCKNPVCHKLSEDTPVILDYLCGGCKSHFEEVRSYLDSVRIEYVINPRIVRGLDYYTGTVFEFISGDIGAQGTVCGGGRYNGLIEELGGDPTPALGFAIGIERLIMLLTARGFEFPSNVNDSVYLVAAGEEAAQTAFVLAAMMRKDGTPCYTDLMSRSVKAQMKHANKLGADFVVVIGENELESGIVRLKDMSTGDETECSITEIPDTMMEITYERTVERLHDATEKFGNMDFNGSENSGEFFLKLLDKGTKGE